MKICVLQHPFIYNECNKYYLCINRNNEFKILGRLDGYLLVTYDKDSSYQKGDIYSKVLTLKEYKNCIE